MRALIVEPSRMIRNIFVSLFSKNGIQAVGAQPGNMAGLYGAAYQALQTR